MPLPPLPSGSTTVAHPPPSTVTPAEAQAPTPRAAAGGEGSERTVVEFLGELLLRAVVKRPALALLFFVLVTVLGALYILRATPIFTSTAVVEIELRINDMVELSKQTSYDPAGNSYLEQSTYLETQRKVIRSRSILAKVGDKLGLIDNPEFTGVNRIEDPAKREEHLERFDVPYALSRIISVQGVRDTNLVEISADYRNPAMAATIANTVADVFVEENLERRMSVTWSAVRWLEKQTGELRAELDESERSMIEFKMKNEILAISFEDRASLTSTQLSSTAAQLATARSQRIQMEAQWEGVRDLDPARDLNEALSAKVVAADPLVAKMRETWLDAGQDVVDYATRYGENHPKLRAATAKLEAARADLDRQVKAVIAAVGREFETAKRIESRLTRDLEDLKRNALAQNRNEGEYNRLLRHRDSTKALYEQLVARAKETNLTSSLRNNNIRIVDRAIPPTSPSKPNRRVLGLMTMFLATVISLILVVGIELLDRSVKSPDEVERLLGLPVIGAVPAFELRQGKIPETEGKDPLGLVAEYLPRSMFSEVFRSIRTNIGVSLFDKKRYVLAVGSGFPSEGKTTITCNLAITFAQAGHKTLLIEADLRKPRLHKVFGSINDKERGTVHAITGQRHPLECVQPTGVNNLDIITYGIIPPNPSELLASDGFHDMLETLKETYDRIIIDTPPVVSVTDSKIIGLVVDGFIVVVRFARVDPTGLSALRRQIQEADMPVLGIVINGVDLNRRGYGFGYGYGYYRYAYASYYASYYKYGYGYGGGYGYGYGTPYGSPYANPYGSPYAQNAYGEEEDVDQPEAASSSGSASAGGAADSGGDGADKWAPRGSGGGESGGAGASSGGPGASSGGA